ncbi:DUF1799 domain-containing protein [Pseudoxanthomonas sp. PXM05]|uniref:DUF1799 domain-containing protein n=1 Tax=Pseudoxanthomonas sp. PXM05 TaxID=2854775 RepID=UPI00210618C7|nr:DUF1799 domain-containing protein [Pseudoxanthomonas sp. PXM05]
MTPDDFPELDDEFGVWPDNVPAVNTFVAMQTQWRTGFAGATGLDYAAMPAVLSLLGIATELHPDTFEGLRCMETRALDLMRKKNG